MGDVIQFPGTRQAATNRAAKRGHPLSNRLSPDVTTLSPQLLQANLLIEAFEVPSAQDRIKISLGQIFDIEPPEFLDVKPNLFNSDGPYQLSADPRMQDGQVVIHVPLSFPGEVTNRFEHSGKPQEKAAQLVVDYTFGYGAVIRGLQRAAKESVHGGTFSYVTNLSEGSFEAKLWPKGVIAEGVYVYRAAATLALHAAQLGVSELGQTELQPPEASLPTLQEASLYNPLLPEEILKFKKYVA